MRAGVLAAVVAMVGCVDAGGSAGTYCRDSRQCRGELICVSLVCREAPRWSGEADAGGDAALVDAARDASVDADLNDTGAMDVGPGDAGEDAGAEGAGAPDTGPEDPCEPIVAAGHLLCVREADRCEAVFQGRGNTCVELCALAGLTCTASYADDDMGMCTYDMGVAFDCMDGDRNTDHCVCER